MPENGRISGTSQGDLLLREKETRDFSTIQGKTVMRMTPEVKDDLCFCLIVNDQANDPVCTSPARS